MPVQRGQVGKETAELKPQRLKQGIRPLRPARWYQQLAVRVPELSVSEYREFSEHSRKFSAAVSVFEYLTLPFFTLHFQLA